MSALTKDQIDALPGLVDEATPGPWGWFGHPNDVKLSATHSGRKFVMDFVRKGFSFAQPRFQPNGRGMVKADELLQFEVGDASVRGEKQARGDGSVYRYDVAGIDAPDARLIALAPSLAATVIEQQAEIERLLDAAWRAGRDAAAEAAGSYDPVAAMVGYELEPPSDLRAVLEGKP